jgi:8-oxo-dGTP pyrophosphatase MutT (NUDIX family)
MDYKKAIIQYQPENGEERGEKEVILQYITQFPETILYRENEFAHMTSSGFIMNKALDKVLMVYHNIYDTWAWTGGHADGDEDLLNVAIKEAKEETGIQKIFPLTRDILSLDILPVWGHYKKGKYISTHMHLSAAYVLIGDEEDLLTIKPDENSGVKWIECSCLESYIKEPKILPIYKKLINRARGLTKKQ